MKAQLSWEFVVTVLLFILSSIYFLFIIYQISPLVRAEMEAETKRAEVFKISEILISDSGDPKDWEKGHITPSFLVYRVPINFSGYGAGISNFSLNLSLDTRTLILSGKMNESCKDIRFTDSAFNYIPYYLESGCNSPQTKIWVRVNLPPANKNETIYLYYGDLSLESLSDAKKIFLFFDDFSNSSYTSGRWYFEKK